MLYHPQTTTKPSSLLPKPPPRGYDAVAIAEALYEA